MWSPLLRQSLIQEFCHRPADARWNVGALWGMVEVSRWAISDTDSQTAFTDLVQRLQSGDREEILSAALVVMESAYEQKAVVIPGLIDSLMQMLGGDAPNRLAGAWALMWLNSRFSRSSDKRSFWLPTASEFTQLVRQKEIPFSLSAGKKDELLDIKRRNRVLLGLDDSEGW